MALLESGQLDLSWLGSVWLLLVTQTRGHPTNDALVAINDSSFVVVGCLRRGAEVDGILRINKFQLVHSFHVLCLTGGCGVDDGGWLVLR